jgi:hypothetical protein
MARRKCKKYGYRKELQSFGPVKRVRFCRTYKGKRPTGWCVWRGKRKETCHRLKRTAVRRARGLRKRCKSRVRVKHAA